MVAALAATISGEEVSPMRLTVREIAGRAATGDPEALYKLAMIHEQGFDSIPQDTVASLALYRLSAEGGNLEAQNYLGYKLLSQGDSEGLKWLEHAAIAGDSKAQANIGYLLLNSDLVENDDAKAAYWLERAASGGVATASSMLGDLYRDGRGVASDSLQAEAHYMAAIDAGLTDAAYKLVEMRGKEWESLPDSVRYAKAIYLYTHRAPQLAVPIFRSIAGIEPESQIAETTFGEVDSDGEVKDAVVVKDAGHAGEISDGTRWVAKSLAMLGDAYTRSMGVAYSYDKSLEYYLAAAIEGDPSAAFVISELLEIFPDALSEYLPEDAPLGAETSGYWLQKAADGGVATAEAAHRRLFAF